MFQFAKKKLSSFYAIAQFFVILRMSFRGLLCFMYFNFVDALKATPPNHHPWTNDPKYGCPITILLRVMWCGRVLVLIRVSGGCGSYALTTPSTPTRPRYTISLNPVCTRHQLGWKCLRVSIFFHTCAIKHTVCALEKTDSKVLT